MNEFMRLLKKSVENRLKEKIDEFLREDIEMGGVKYDNFNEFCGVVYEVIYGAGMFSDNVIEVIDKMGLKGVCVGCNYWEVLESVCNDLMDLWSGEYDERVKVKKYGEWYDELYGWEREFVESRWDMVYRKKLN